MGLEPQAHLGSRFRALHQQGTFVLVNVADAGTAAAVAGSGAVALATTSAGHASIIGRRDAAGDVEMEEHGALTRAIVDAAGELPVNVDAEHGYGHEPEDVARCIRYLAGLGAVGAGIEDWSGDSSIGFYDDGLAVARIEAAVETAASLDVTFTVTGRTEFLLYEAPDAFARSVARLNAFADVGAHCLYAPGTWDLETITRLSDAVDGPLNVLVLVGEQRFGMDELAGAGVRRVSLGSSLYNAQVGFARDTVASILSTGRLGTASPPR